MRDSDETGFLIRPCRAAEAEGILELWRQADATPSVTDNADAVERVITEFPAHVLVAEVEGRIVGSIIGTFDGWRGNIYRLAVDPRYRRRGIARALVAERTAQKPSSRLNQRLQLRLA